MCMCQSVFGITGTIYRTLVESTMSQYQFLVKNLELLSLIKRDTNTKLMLSRETYLNAGIHIMATKHTRIPITKAV
ncbi:hypothetical protein I7I50_07619 [Histoplasma capsulatum G186AR]|uniref:Uncharacterized protein n=1 Tax=Ajellomyces capsulatus TaxID=5037 RepID=A0A8H7Z0V3_AJECA|nr:hypothetical protein I7I52_09309 [Histoplasma capsulatum]QSS68267.1 hypothetical protein I7I50_07619 [Histoplasma capsulatum G186AR]